MKDISNSIRYFIKAYKNPTLIMSIISKKADKVAIILKINMMVGILLVLTSLIKLLNTETPVLRPVLQLGSNGVANYYLFQSIYILPLALLMWIMLSGVLYLLAIMGKSASRRFFFDDALVIITFAWALPVLILVGIPNLLIYPITGILLSPFGELLRCYILPGLWQIFLTGIGVNEIFNVKPLKSFLIGLISTGIFYMMVYVFVR